MVSDVVEGPLTEAVHRLAEVFHPVRMYLFGSRARDEGDAESDYDVLVLVEERTGKPYQMEQQAYRALSGLAIPVDIVLMSREHFERRRKVSSSLPAIVEREGKLLYV